MSEDLTRSESELAKITNDELNKFNLIENSFEHSDLHKIAEMQ